MVATHACRRKFSQPTRRAHPWDGPHACALLGAPFRYLSSEVITEYNERLAKGDETVNNDDLVAIAREVIPFNMQHNAEADACDLLMELERIGDIVEHVDKTNYARVCLYLSTYAHSTHARVGPIRGRGQRAIRQRGAAKDDALKDDALKDDALKGAGQRAIRQRGAAKDDALNGRGFRALRPLFGRLTHALHAH